MNGMVEMKSFKLKNLINFRNNRMLSAGLTIVLIYHQIRSIDY